MFKSYCILAIRNLRRHQVFSILNIAGLAAGITCFILLSLFIRDELSFDTFNKQAGNIYRLYIHLDINGRESNSSKTAPPTGATLKRDFPEVTAYTRIGYPGTHSVRYQEKIFREYHIYTADSAFFTIFSYPFLYGNPKTALDHPGNIVLTETSATRYFGKENPVGKSLIVDGTNSYLVTGVMKDFPYNSHFNCDFILSAATFPEASSSQDWLEGGCSTYIVLKDGTSAADFKLKLRNIVVKYVGPQVEKALGVSITQFIARGNAYEILMQPLLSVYLYSKTKYGIDRNTEWSGNKTGDITYVYIFAAVALFILLIAVVNFMNLSTARSEKRAKEVGIKKTLGSNRQKLIFQFITESVIMVSIAVLIALVLVALIIPWFNDFTGRHLQLHFFEDEYTLPFLICFTLVTGILAGSYPAFYLSSFQPIDIMKSGVKKRKSSLRSLLVVFQFSISITLIIGMIIIRSQLQFIQQKDLGFKKENMISIDNAALLGSNLKLYKDALLRNPKITAVTNTSLMFYSGVPGDGYLFEKKSGTDPLPCQYLDVDCDFVKTFDIQLVAGRFFSEGWKTDSNAVIINESALEGFNTKTPLQKEITRIGNGNKLKTFKIIGVVKDFNYESLHQVIRPLIFHLSPVQQSSSILNIRVQPGSENETIKYINDTWNQFTTEEKCDYSLLNENLAGLYDSERKIGVITAIFSMLAIFIACLGLFGLAVFITEQRIKEIGVRKILGASIYSIIFTITKPFILWVLIANLMAWPIAYMIMHNWLQNFAYRVDISIWVFILSGFLVALIALLTVSIEAVKAARMNPVNCLRSE